MGQSGSGGTEDALAVELHDAELAQEVELTARLMVAANESDDRLAVETVDDILGVDQQETAQPPALPPRQRNGQD